MKYVLTIMMRLMVKLNLIEIKIQDLQIFLHFLFFCCAGRLHRNLNEIKKKNLLAGGLDVRGSGCYLCIVKLNTALTEVMVIISLRLRKKFTGNVLDACGSMCYLCIVKLNTALTEVMFDGNNLNEINPDVFPDPSACILRFILLTLFNYIVEKYLVYFLHIFEKSVTFVP